MTLGRSETGMDNSIIPKVGNGKRMEKKHSQNSGAGRERKKIPQIQEWEGNEKIYSQNSGMGIRCYHSLEYPEAGTGMKKYDNKKRIFSKYVD